MVNDYFELRYLTSIILHWIRIAYNLSRIPRRQSATVKPHLLKHMAYKDRPTLLWITRDHHTLPRTGIPRRILARDSGIRMHIHMAPVAIPLLPLAEMTAWLDAA